MNIDRLETPSLIVEEKIFYKNMETMKKLLEGTNLALRPHFKSNKSTFIAHEQIKYGAKGITCAKLSEAVDLADSGIEDILIANQIVEPRKIDRLAQLAGDCRLTVCVDDHDNIKALSKAAKNAGTVIHCLIEYDIGMERCGVTDEDTVLRLAEDIGGESHLVFDGIQAYAGHISHVVSRVKREKMTADNYNELQNLLRMLKSKGMEAETVSGGSTGTSLIKAKEGLYTELQAGSYIFMDATYRCLGLPFENSLFVLSTVVSARDGLTVIDSGVKSCGMDQGDPVICGASAEKIVASEEHFQLHLLSKPKNIGDKVLLIPGHCCSTVNLYDRIYMVDNGKVTDRIPITSRGFSR